jgi:cysteine-rich repeat protein
VGSSSCSGSYTVGYCGDGLKNGPEACDDANTNNTDNCLNSCQWNASCGDGVTQAFAGESCDDGNTSNADSCLNSCA